MKKAMLVAIFIITAIAELMIIVAITYNRISIVFLSNEFLNYQMWRNGTMVVLSKMYLLVIYFHTCPNNFQNGVIS